MTSAQLSEWEAYDRLEPIGEGRADFRMAYTVSAITNIARAIWGKKGSVMSSPDDFMPKWGEEAEEQETTVRSLGVHGWVEKRKQTVDEMKQIVYSIAGAFKVKKGKEK